MIFETELPDSTAIKCNLVGIFFDHLYDEGDFLKKNEWLLI